MILQYVVLIGGSKRKPLQLDHLPSELTHLWLGDESHEH